MSVNMTDANVIVWMLVCKGEMEPDLSVTDLITRTNDPTVRWTWSPTTTEIIQVSHFKLRLPKFYYYYFFFAP